MRNRVTVVLAVLGSAALAGIAIWRLVDTIKGGSPSVQTLEHSIEAGLNDQLMPEALNYSGPPTATVTCPQSAGLTKGSVFYCDASIEFTSTPLNGPGVDVSIQHRRLKVTMGDDDKARWRVVR